MSNVESQIIAGDLMESRTAESVEEAEMEEGELLEDGELSDVGVNDASQQQQQQRSSSHHQQKSDEQRHHHHGSKKDKSSSSHSKNNSTHSSSSSSGKKRKHEQHANASSNETKTSSNEGVNDVAAFLKKKKQELAEKVKSQLRLAGVEARVGSGDESDPECIKPDNKSSFANRASVGASKRASTSAVDPIGPVKYYDLDKVDDPTETMLSNWAKGKSLAAEKSKTVKSPPAISYEDPYDEYYGSSSTSATAPVVDNMKIDQDYRFGNNSKNPSDQDFRVGNNYDIDYRRKVQNRGDPGFRTPSDGSDGGVYSEEEENAANEFGDIDERHRPTSSKRPLPSNNNGRIPLLKAGRRPPRRYEDSGTESNEDPDQPDRNVPSGRHSNRTDANRRRARSRSPLQRRRPGGRMGDRNGMADNSPLVCKFYREGYCREGDNCPYVHEDSSAKPQFDKKAELCKFYLTGFCRNGRRCPFLHEEYPCKFFHKGECSKGDECRYSHEPLNEFTRPIFERVSQQMMKDEEMASKVSVPDAPSRRKVLLGSPPKMPPPINGPHPAIHYNPYSNDSKQHLASSYYDNRTSSPQGIFNNNSSLQYGYDSHAQMSTTSPLKDLSNNNDKFDDNAHDVSIGDNNGDKVTIDIAAMLRQIKAEVTGEEVQESPASPEPSSQSAVFIVRQPLSWPEYRLIPFDLVPKNLSLNSPLIQSYLKDPKLVNDPRIKKMFNSQFDAVSSMISSQDAAKDQTPAESPASKDPRSVKANAASTRDPRLKPASVSGSGGNGPPLLSQPPPQMINPHQMPSISPPPNFMGPPMPPQMPANAPSMMMMNPQSMYGQPPGNPMLMGPPGLLPPPPPQGGSSSWMPQMNSGMLPPPSGLGWLPPPPMMMPPGDGRFSGPPTTFSGPVMDAPLPQPPKDPRARRNPASFIRPQAANVEQTVAASSPPATGTPAAPATAAVVSLREKRKNLEYESPLSQAEKSSSGNSGSDENRYHQNLFSAGIKLKKKDSVDE